MDDGRNILVEGGEQLRGRARLVGARDGKDHPPMAAQKIRTPRAAAFGLEQLFARPAEFTQAGISGNDDLPFAWIRCPRVARKDFTNQVPAGFVIGAFLTGIEPRVTAKLPHRAREDKTAVRVFRLWFAPADGGFAGGRIELIGPQQFIGKGEGVACKFKAPATGFNWTCLG